MNTAVLTRLVKKRRKQTPLANRQSRRATALASITISNKRRRSHHGASAAVVSMVVSGERVSVAFRKHPGHAGARPSHGVWRRHVRTRRHTQGLQRIPFVHFNKGSIPMCVSLDSAGDRKYSVLPCNRAVLSFVNVIKITYLVRLYDTSCC